MSYSDVVLADSPLAFYKLNDASGTTAADSGGSGDDGTYINGVTLQQHTMNSDVGGQSVALDGVDDYIALPSASVGAINIAATGWSFECWVRPSAANSYSRVFDFGNGSSSDNLLLCRNGSDSSAFVFNCYNNTTSSPNYSISLPLNVISHVVVTISTTFYLHIYVNGVLVVSAQLQTLRNVTRNNCWIGRSNWTGDSYFAGKFQGVSIYAAELSAAQVSKHFVAGAITGYSAVVSADMPTAFYKLNESSGTTATDSSGNGYNATYVNGVYLGDLPILNEGTSSRFDGIDDYVALPEAVFDGIDFSQGFSFEAWLCNYGDVSGNARIFEIANNPGTSPTDNIVLCRAGSSGNLSFLSYSGSTTGASFTVASLPDAASYTHIVLTMNTAKLVTIYVNGSSAGASAMAYMPAHMARTFATLGKSAYNSDGLFMGKMQAVSFYPYVLSSGQVANHHNAGVISGVNLSGRALKMLGYVNPGATPANYFGRGQISPKKSGDIYYQGGPNVAASNLGLIAGTVKVDGVAVSRQVRVFDRKSGLLVKAMNAADDGTFSFPNMRIDFQYDVVAQDWLNNYNSIIFDRVAPYQAPVATIPYTPYTAPITAPTYTSTATYLNAMKAAGALPLYFFESAPYASGATVADQSASGTSSTAGVINGYASWTAGSNVIPSRSAAVGAQRSATNATVQVKAAAKANNFSVEFAFSVGTLSSSSEAALYSESTGGLYIRITPQTDLTKFKLHILSSTTLDIGTFSTVFSTGQNYHVIITVGSDGVARLYVNSVVDTTTWATSFSASGNNPYLFYDAATAESCAAPIDIQAFAHYPSALTQAQVTALFDSFEVNPTRALDNVGVSALAAYSLRRLRGAYTGYAANLRRADGATMDLGFDTSDGPDTATALTWSSGSTVTIAKWYDQSGNGLDAVQSSAGNQPVFIASGALVNTTSSSGTVKPNLKFDSSATYLPLPSALWGLVSTMTVNTVAWAPDTVNRISVGWSSSSAGGQLILNSNGGAWYNLGDSTYTYASVTLNRTFIQTMVSASKAVSCFYNGTLVGNFTGGSGQSGSDGNIGSWVSAYGHSNVWAGGIAEVIVFSSALSSADRLALEENQGAYYGVTVP